MSPTPSDREGLIRELHELSAVLRRGAFGDRYSSLLMDSISVLSEEPDKRIADLEHRLDVAQRHIDSGMFALTAEYAENDLIIGIKMLHADLLLARSQGRAEGIEEAAKWHDQRAHDTPDAFETEFHQVSAATIRKLSDPKP